MSRTLLLVCLLIAAAPAAAAEPDGGGPDAAPEGASEAPPEDGSEAAPGAVEAASDSLAVPRCSDGGLIVSGAEGEVVVPLPGPCLGLASAGAVIAVAGGAAGAFVVTRAGEGPSVQVLPTTGEVRAVRWVGDLLLLDEVLRAPRLVDPGVAVPAGELPAPSAPSVASAPTPAATAGEAGEDPEEAASRARRRALDERMRGPQDNRGLASIKGSLMPAIGVGRDGGFLMLGRVSAAWIAPIPLRLEAAVTQSQLVAVEGAPTWMGGAVEGLVSLDLPPFEIGVSGGYQQFAGSYRGGAFGQYLRAGFRDGIVFDVRVRWVVDAETRFGAPDPVGFLEGSMKVPLHDLFRFTAAGGGGSGFGLATVGVEIRVVGQGGRGTLYLNPALGVQWSTFRAPSEEDVDPLYPDYTPSGTRYYSVIGPGAGISVEWRP